jgi:hypothetical protein
MRSHLSIHDANGSKTRINFKGGAVPTFEEIPLQQQQPGDITFVMPNSLVDDIPSPSYDDVPPPLPHFDESIPLFDLLEEIGREANKLDESVYLMNDTMQNSISKMKKLTKKYNDDVASFRSSQSNRLSNNNTDSFNSDNFVNPSVVNTHLNNNESEGEVGPRRIIPEPSPEKPGLGLTLVDPLSTYIDTALPRDNSDNKSLLSGVDLESSHSAIDTHDIASNMAGGDDSQQSQSTDRLEENIKRTLKKAMGKRTGGSGESDSTSATEEPVVEKKEKKEKKANPWFDFVAKVREFIGKDKVPKKVGVLQKFAGEYKTRAAESGKTGNELYEYAFTLFSKEWKGKGEARMKELEQ